MFHPPNFGLALSPLQYARDRPSQSLGWMSLAFTTLLFCIRLNVAAPLRAADSVAVENTKPGTTLWQLTNPASMYGDNVLDSDSLRRC
jgi:hypothetical protein